MIHLNLTPHRPIWKYKEKVKSDKYDLVALHPFWWNADKYTRTCQYCGRHEFQRRFYGINVWVPLNDKLRIDKIIPGVFLILILKILSTFVT